MRSTLLGLTLLVSSMLPGAASAETVTGLPMEGGVGAADRESCALPQGVSADASRPEAISGGYPMLAKGGGSGGPGSGSQGSGGSGSGSQGSGGGSASRGGSNTSARGQGGYGGTGEGGYAGSTGQGGYGVAGPDGKTFNQPPPNQPWTNPGSPPASPPGVPGSGNMTK
jgi:hypothetical protein